MHKKDVKTNRIISALIFLIVLAIGVTLASSIGPAWDEPDNIVSGGVYWNFFERRDPSILINRDKSASHFMNTIYTQEPTLARYPPVPNFVGIALVAVGERVGFRVTNKNIIIAFHLATVLFFALLVACMYQWGILLGFSRLVSLFAVGATLLYPTLFGHGLSNLKDTAQVALFVTSLYLLTKGTLKKIPHDIVLAAIVWGLGLATKINVIYVPVIWFIWIVLSSEWFLRLLRHPQRIMNHELGIMSKKKELFMILYSLFILLAVGLATAILVWPYLWFDPVNRAMEVIRYFSTVGEGYRIFWNGSLLQVGVGKSLWWYPWANLGIVTPLGILFLAVIGLVLGIQKRTKTHMLLVIWLVVPMLRAFLPSAAFYDGIRHFMEVIPPIVLLASIAIARLAEQKFVRVNRLGAYGAIIVAVGVILHLLVVNVTYFPYATGYYNALAYNANRRFDRDIEGLSIKEGVDYLHAKYGNIRLWAPIAGHLSWYYVRAGDLYVYNTGDADSIIFINKSSHASNDDFYASIVPLFHLDHVIARDGAIFAWIYRKNP